MTYKLYFFRTFRANQRQNKSRKTLILKAFRLVEMTGIEPATSRLRILYIYIPCFLARPKTLILKHFLCSLFFRLLLSFPQMAYKWHTFYIKDIILSSHVYYLSIKYTIQKDSKRPGHICPGLLLESFSCTVEYTDTNLSFHSFKQLHRIPIKLTFYLIVILQQPCIPLTTPSVLPVQCQ